MQYIYKCIVYENDLIMQYILNIQCINKDFGIQHVYKYIVYENDLVIQHVYR